MIKIDSCCNKTEKEEYGMPETMIFNVKNGFCYHWSGRFIAPNDNWIHMTRELVDYELVLVTEGTLSIECDEKEYSVNEGEYLLMSPSKIQRGTKQGYCSFYWLHFIYKEDMMNSLNPLCSDVIEIKQQAMCQSKERLIILLKELQDSDKRYRNEILNNFLTGAVLTELSLQDNVSGKKQMLFSRDQLNSDIKTYISWHISENLKIEDIAEYFEYNEKYLTTFFKKMNGLPLKQFLMQKKMEYAKAILTESNNTVSEVAYSIGFSDVHNFSNAFKKIVGMSPGMYRIQYDKHSIFDK